MSDGSGVSLSCAQQAKRVLKFCKFCGSGCRTMIETELHEAAEQQRQIMQIRLRKWLRG